MKKELTMPETYEAPVAECIEIKFDGGLMEGTTQGAGDGGEVPFPGGN